MTAKKIYRYKLIQDGKIVKIVPAIKRAEREKSIEELLAEVDLLWGEPISPTFNYTIGKFPLGWRFDVVNSWHKWMDKNLETHFYGETIRMAIKIFLRYVKNNKINVKKLLES